MTSDDQATRLADHMISSVTGTITGIGDPTDRARAAAALLAAVPRLQSGLREIRQAAVQELRAQGHSWAEVGEAIGVHRNRAQQIGEGRSGGKKQPSA
jgi:hypothetical protein